MQSYTVYLVDDFDSEGLPPPAGVPRADIVCFGGTFDHLHRGHLTLCATAVACVNPGGEVLIGVADGPLLVRKQYRELIRPFKVRAREVEDVILHYVSMRQDLVELADSPRRPANAQTLRPPVESASPPEDSDSHSPPEQYHSRAHHSNNMGEPDAEEIPYLQLSKASCEGTRHTDAKDLPTIASAASLTALPYASAHSSLHSYRQIPSGLRPNVRVRIFPITEPFGPSVTPAMGDGVLVVSPETILGGYMVNKERVSRGLPCVGLVIAPLYTDTEGDKVSSTRLREEESVSLSEAG